MDPDQLTSSDQPYFQKLGIEFGKSHVHALVTSNTVQTGLKIISVKKYNPANIFCPENVACLLHLMHIFKCTSEYFCHGSKHYEP